MTNEKMKVGYFEKRSQSGLRDCYSFTSNCIYIPEEQVILYTNEGDFEQYFFLEKEGSNLEEAKFLAEGKNPNDIPEEGCVSSGDCTTFSEISWFEYCANDVKELINTFQQKQELEEKISPLEEKIREGTRNILSAGKK